MTSQLFLQLCIPRRKDGRNHLFESPTIKARGHQSWPALKVFPKDLYTQFCLEEFLSLRRVPLGFDLLRGKPVRFVEVKVTLRMEVPKGEHSFSSISLKRVLREGVMGLSKIAFFRTLLRIGILLTVRAFPIMRGPPLTFFAEFAS